MTEIRVFDLARGGTGTVLDVGTGDEGLVRVEVDPTREKSAKATLGLATNPLLVPVRSGTLQFAGREITSLPPYARAALGIGSKTVETHLSRLFERFGVVSRADLAARAVGEGWLDVPPGA